MNRQDGNITPQSNIELMAIVGIGASAGGLKSIESLFEIMPIDLGVAFVVIQHLSPKHKSLMTPLLARHTQMPVVLVQDELTLQPNHIYVIPPGKELRCVGATLVVTKLQDGQNRPIDTFFNSLAANEGIPSIGIVLSGTGSDGSQGIEAVHRSGGLTIAESPKTAEFDGMPKNAIRTDAVELVLRTEEIPKALRTYLGDPLDAEAVVETNMAGIQRIFTLLAKRFDIQFAQYKPQTLIRRINRRKSLGMFNTLDEYVEHIESSPTELDDLLNDLLIGVTKFFRDTSAFESVEDQIKAAIASFPEGQTYRVWTIGCATGEEAYSIAMLILDTMAQLNRYPMLKVFATDIHERYLELASRGEFSPEAMEFVSLARQTKYFETLEDGRFRATPQLRQHLVFSRHNAIQDPPFTNIHLVSCRNMLIYLASKGQITALISMQHALVPEGLLFLGTSESIGDLSEDFEEVDKKWKIFRKIRERRESIPQVPHISSFSSDFKVNLHKLSGDRPASMTTSRLLDVYDELMKSTMTMGLILDEKQNLLHKIGNVSSIFRNGPHRIRGTIEDIIEPPASAKIMEAMLRAWMEPGIHFLVEQVQPNTCVSDFFNVSVLALRRNEANVGWILRFDPVEKKQETQVTITHAPSDAYKLLDSELQLTKENLNTSVEELESANEELQATNEEMVASNEELQSTNEELQSVNEELHSVNSELHRKIDELEETTSDLETFLNSSYVGTIFLDSEQRIRKFTKATKRHFNLVNHDVGRPLSHFANRLRIPHLSKLIGEVVATGISHSSIELDEYGEEINLNIDPLRKSGNVSGSVLTMLRSTPSAIDEAVSLSAAQIGLWEWPDITKDAMWWSPTCYRLLGLDPQSPSLFSIWKQMIHPDDVQQLRRVGMNTCTFIEQGHIRFRMLNSEDEYCLLEFRNICRRDRSQVIRSMVGTVIDAHLSLEESTTVEFNAQKTEADES